MMEIATTAAMLLLGIAMIGAVIRVIVGPTLADRILGLDVVSTLAVWITAAFAARTGQYLYLDIAVAVALVTFLSTVAFARYMLSRLEVKTR